MRVRGPLEDKDDQRTYCYVEKLNYAVWDKEIKMQCNLMAEEHANTIAIHCCELKHMEKDI